jgi:prepilin signal peptidase PulO-like enzyme (type II secretory pathway)
VEILMGAAAMILSVTAPSASVFLSQMVVFTSYTLIAVIDLEHRLILHVVSGPTAILIGVIGVIDPNRGAVKTLSGGLTGFAIFLLLYLFGGVFAPLMARLRDTEIDEVAFGFGDVTLAGVIGLTVGWPGVLPALVIGILAAGGFSMIYIMSMLLRRDYNPFKPIPYGPFLILGSLFVYFGGVGFIANSL